MAKSEDKKSAPKAAPKSSLTKIRPRKPKLPRCRVPRGLCLAAGLLYTSMRTPAGRRRYHEVRRQTLEFEARVSAARKAALAPEHELLATGT